MKKILGLTVAAILVIGLVGGGTWAYFSDTEESTGNVFSAGTLDLGLDNNYNQNPAGSTTATFGASALEPGSTAGTGTLWVNNEGTIDMSHVYVSFAVASYGENTPDTIDGYDDTDDTDDLSKMIIATVVEWDGGTVGALEGKSIDELIALGATDLGTLDADEELDLYIEWTFDSTATNGCQGDSVDLTVTLQGTQN
jgi:spore coat-associated protein N